MPLLSEPEPPARRPRRGWPYVLVLLAAAAGAGYYLYLTRFAAPSEEAERRAAVETPAPARSAPAAPEAPAPEPAAAPTPEPEEPSLDPEPEPEPEPTAPVPPAIVLRVTSDVDGAEVFIDRRYAGTTPFESHEVEPGRHRLNVSAPGYEGHAEDIEIDAGALTAIDVRFRQVRLDQRIAVVHRHRFGDCTGHLVATTAGVAYRTDDDDAFEVGLDGIEEFAVDYMAHNLRLKVRGGRTYNFTDNEENADALFVFHRAVETARERLALGEPAAAP